MGDGSPAVKAKHGEKVTETPAQLLKEAEKQAEIAKANPSNAAAWLGAGDAYFAAGEKQKALECYNRLLKFIPGELEKLGLLEQAKSSLHKALEIEYNSAEFNSHLGNLYLREKKYETALNYLGRAVDYAPGNSAYRKEFVRVIEEICDSVEDTPSGRAAASAFVNFLRWRDGGERESITLLLTNDTAMSFLAECIEYNNTSIDGSYFGVVSLDETFTRLARNEKYAELIFTRMLTTLKETGANDNLLELASKYMEERPELALKHKEIIPLLFEPLKHGLPSDLCSNRFSEEYYERLSHDVACNQIAQVLAKIGQTEAGRALIMPHLMELMRTPGVYNNRAGSIIHGIMKGEGNREFMFRFLTGCAEDKSAVVQKIVADTLATGINESDYKLLQSIGATNTIIGLLHDFYPELRGLKGEDVFKSFHNACAIAKMLDAKGSIAQFLTSAETVDAFYDYLSSYLKMDPKLREGFVLAFFPAYMASHYIGKDFEPRLLSLLKCKTYAEQERWVKVELAPYLKQKMEARDAREQAEEKAGATRLGRLSRFFRKKKKAESVLAGVGDDWRDILTRAAIHPALKLERYLDEKAEYARVQQIMGQLQVDRNDFKDFVLGLAYAYHLRRVYGSHVERIKPKMHSAHVNLHLRGMYSAEYRTQEVRITGSLFSLTAELGHYSARELTTESYSKRIEEKDGIGLFFAGGQMTELEDRLALNSEKTYPPEAQNALDFVYHTYMLGKCIAELEADNPEIAGQLLEIEQRLGVIDRKRWQWLSPSEVYAIGRLLLGKFTPTSPETKEHADAAQRLLGGLAQEHIDEIVGVTMVQTGGHTISVEIQLPLPYQELSGPNEPSSHRLAERLSIDAAVTAALIARDGSFTVSLMPYIHEYLRSMLVGSGIFGVSDARDFGGALSTLQRSTPTNFLGWMEKGFPGYMQAGETIAMNDIASQEIREALIALSQIAANMPDAKVQPRLVEAAVIHLIYKKYGLETDLDKAYAALEKFNPTKDRLSDIFARYEKA